MAERFIEYTQESAREQTSAAGGAIKDLTGRILEKAVKKGDEDRKEGFLRSVWNEAKIRMNGRLRMYFQGR